MTDKVQKIREEVERLKGWNNNVRNSTRHMTLQEEDFNRGKHSSYLEILNFIDSLQEESVSEELEEVAQEYVTKEGYLAGLHFNSMVRSFKAGAEWHASHNTKLPDNLLLAARKASIDMLDIDDNYLDEYPYNPIAEQKFIEGAKWQKEKTLKESEDAIQYVKENHSPSEVSDFQNAMNIAVMKAFDAGKEKMREQMMVKAIDVEVKIDAGGYPFIPQMELYDYDKDVPLAKEGDKYKVILIKED